MSLASYHCSTPGLVSLLGCGSRRLGLAAAMAAKNTRRRKLTQFMSHHVFRDEQLDELLAVVNLEGVADEIRHDHAVARPRLERLLARPHALDLGQQPLVHIRPTFLQFLGTAHTSHTLCLE